MIDERTKRKYLNSAPFHAVVDSLRALLRDGYVEANELPDALSLALELADRDRLEKHAVRHRFDESVDELEREIQRHGHAQHIATERLLRLVRLRRIEIASSPGSPKQAPPEELE